MTGASNPAQRRASPRRRLWPKLVVLSASLAVSVFVVDRVIGAFNVFGVHHQTETHRYRTELTELRIRKPDGTLDLDGELFRHIPGAQASFSGFTVKINSLGCRGPEIGREKPAGVYRIVALGDSVTFGWGIDDEHTFLRRLEADLNAQAGERRYEVVNTGHPMFDTVQEHAMLQRYAMALRPDLVILTYVLNDIDPSRDVVQGYLDALAKGEPATPAERESLWASALPSITPLVRHCFRRIRAAKGVADEAYMRQFVKDRERGWRRSREALHKIRDLCRLHDVPFIVLDNTDPRIHELAEFCAAEDIPCFDLTFTEAEKPQPIYNSLFDPHNNALGNELLLQKLKRALREAGLFEFR